MGFQLIGNGIYTVAHIVILIITELGMYHHLLLHPAPIIFKHANKRR
jgi:hypothetical protein